MRDARAPASAVYPLRLLSLLTRQPLTTPCRSVLENSTRNASAMSVKMLSRGFKTKGSAGVAGVIRAQIPYIKSDIPILILFRALGFVVGSGGKGGGLLRRRGKALEGVLEWIVHMSRAPGFVKQRFSAIEGRYIHRSKPHYGHHSHTPSDQVPLQQGSTCFPDVPDSTLRSCLG